MTITTRSGKGSPLTNSELDTNFTDLVAMVGAVTPTSLGLGNVTNTSDANKPVSTVQQTALDLKANLVSPALSGIPSAPTAAVNTNTTQLATTAHVFAERSGAATLTNKTINLANNSLVATSAQLAAAVTDETGTGSLLFSNSPVMSGVPTIPTALLGTRTLQAASTEYVESAWDRGSLSAISQSIHFGPIVKTFLYDTSKDSDGGAWRKRCQQTSWYTEAICPGTWRKQLVNLAAAWAVTGAAAGDYYQNTTDGKFYMIGGTIGAQTQSEVFRGNSREFPEQTNIVVESGRVVIYDPTQPGCPMWKVLKSGPDWLINTYSGTLTTAFMIQGCLYIGTSARTLSILNFVSDRGFYGDPSGNIFATTVPLAAALNISYYAISGRLVYNIGSGVVTDIAGVVLDGAPIDPATGLPIPTIVAATAGGVGIIKSDGTVVTWMASAGVAQTVSISPSGQLFTVGGQGVGFACYSRSSIPITTPDNTYTNLFSQNSIPTRLGLDGGTGLLDVHCLMGSGTKVVASSVRPLLYLLKENPANLTKGMVANITNAFNTGWQVGDSRGCWLADTVAETIVSTELIPNGTFNSNITGITVVGSTTLSRDTTVFPSGGLKVVTPGGATQGVNLGTFTTVIGKTYVVSADMYAPSANTAVNSVVLSLNTTALFDAVTVQLTAEDIVQNKGFSFVAGATTTTVYGMLVNIGVAWGSAGDIGYFDNVTCRLADIDRSVKATNLAINGSITKSPVAVGAQLVGYSGFSASNYLEQPYRANLDFGTGDFCVMGWVNLLDTTLSSVITDRQSTGIASDWTLQISVTTGCLAFVYQNVAAVVSTLGVPVGQPSLVGYYRTGGKGYFFVNGVTQNIDTGASTSLTDAAAKLRIGCNAVGSASFRGAIALIRISATAPSADQILDIYNTELPLFQANAKCVLPGAASTVSSLASDDTTGLLHVGQADYRSSWSNLLRVDAEASTVGTITSISANQGAILTGGTSSGRYYQPAMLLRDELRRKDEARKALGKVPVFFDFDAVTSQVAFVLPKGYTTKAVYLAGTLKRLGATKDYLTSFDGYQETITFGTAPGNTVWLSIMCVRSN